MPPGASSREVTQTRRPPARPSSDQRGRYSPAGALDQHRVARPGARLAEEHPVRGQPGRRQAGRLGEAQLGRLVDQVGRRAPRPVSAKRARDSARTAATAAGRRWRRMPAKSADR